ncbi:hypothetical protein LCGC14_1858960 [marine sediment metagenome]|uniref:Uncharacterized protein n=1 Tax=marine sediment metagenome TaxID=412755 RepID=A0A0F9G7X2_9ZZZZ
MLPLPALSKRTLKEVVDFESAYNIGIFFHNGMAWLDFEVQKC